MVCEKGLILLVLAISLLMPVSAQILLGTVDGFIVNVTGGTVANASVNASVVGCSGVGCSENATSGSNGYYLVTNLDIDSGNTILVVANKTNSFGNNTGTAGAFSTATINVTIAPVPNPPTLVAINDTHNNTFILFNWTPGIDPGSLPTYDIFVFDGTSFNNTNPTQNRSFVSFSLHTWSVQTCNSFGCSAQSTDTFNVTNSPPPAPTLQDVPNTVQNNITFNWSLVTDIDNDTVTYRFRLDSQATETNVTPPLNRPGLSFGSHTWRVQACDPFDCSSFSTDTFSITNNPPSAPNLTDINDTTNTIITFTWISGTDLDNETTYDEFQFNSSTLLSNVTSPQTTDLTGIIAYVTWRVRTCDIRGACSAYSNDSFIRFECT